MAVAEPSGEAGEVARAVADRVQTDDGRPAADVVVGEPHAVDRDEAAGVGSADGVATEGTDGAGVGRNDAGGRSSDGVGGGHALVI